MTQRNAHPTDVQRLDALLRDFVRLLAELCRLNGELLQAIRDKRDAMKRGHVGDIAAAVEREGNLIATIRERDGFRRQLMAQIGRSLREPELKARKWRAKDLVARVPAGWGRDIQQASGALREVIEEVTRENRACDAIAGGVVDHLSQVFGWVGSGAGPAVGYDPKGRPISTREQRLIEAVG
ncbi:MAG: hypothetical protein C4547_13365 [Phycisphaerales bacterium]|nr:MAG: hypothetical protein C4547_13365 [Phycisphaerales bacterium]